ncbi:hypothetical protein BRD56_02660 [Thermoplasmatales archaeon SW_10_69_26]|nr:MAG: hypothetical protein BRD56_02660 [Thermoplasmatales archaeon SW_10_69_26]
MYIKDEEGTEDQEMKEIKVKIPVKYHWKLHTLKLTTDAYISEMVRTALDGYFGEVFESDDEEAEGNEPEAEVEAA